MFKRVRSYWRIKKAADRLLDHIEKEQKLLSKSIFTSRTFWLNILALLNELIKILPLNPSLQGYTVPTEVVASALPVANIVLRRFTSQPVTIIPEPSTGGKW